MFVISLPFFIIIIIISIITVDEGSTNDQFVTCVLFFSRHSFKTRRMGKLTVTKRDSSAKSVCSVYLTRHSGQHYSPMTDNHVTVVTECPVVRCVCDDTLHTLVSLFYLKQSPKFYLEKRVHCPACLSPTRSSAIKLFTALTGLKR